MTDRHERFPFVWCDTCKKIQPMTFDVMPANDKNDHDSADIVCNECKSVIAIYGVQWNTPAWTISCQTFQAACTALSASV